MDRLDVPAVCENAPPGTYRIMPMIESDVAEWRKQYGTRCLPLAERTIYRLRDDTNGRVWFVYFVRLRDFPLAHVHNAYIVGAWIRLSAQQRAEILKLGYGPAIPIEAINMMVWRDEDTHMEAWPGEMNDSGPVSDASERRWGAVG